MVVKECPICGVRARIYLSQCKHRELCLRCGKTLAVTKDPCPECGDPLERVTHEIEIRSCSPAEAMSYRTCTFPHPGDLPSDFNVQTRSLQEDAEHKLTLTLTNETGRTLLFEGRRIRPPGADKFQYHLLVPRGDDVRVAIPTGDYWYEFRRLRPEGHQPTLEEAETIMRNRQRAVDRAAQRFGMMSTGQRHSNEEEEPTGDGFDYEHVFSDDDVDSVPETDHHVPSPFQDEEEAEAEKAVLPKGGQ